MQDAAREMRSEVSGFDAHWPCVELLWPAVGRLGAVEGLAHACRVPYSLLSYIAPW